MSDPGVHPDSPHQKMVDFLAESDRQSVVHRRLTEAADFLDHLADEAQYKAGRWFVDVAGPIATTQWLGPTHDVLTATVPQAQLANTFSPVAARLLSTWLRREAEEVAVFDSINNKDPDNPYKTRVLYRAQTSDALAFADHVLKGKP